MNIILIGPQASGKGTMAQRIEEEFGWPQISMGKLLRKEAGKNTKEGKWIGKLINSGIIVPSRLTTKILLGRLEKKDCIKGFQLDGYPRNIDNFRELKRYLAKKGETIGLVFFLRLSKKTAIRRLGSRIQCKKCERIYNTITLKPKRRGVCDRCGEKLIQRVDDRPKAIAKRFKLFRKQTMPIIKLLKKEYKIAEINAEVNVEKEYTQIRKTIKSALHASGAFT